MNRSRMIQVRLTGALEFTGNHLCESVTITNHGDLVVSATDEGMPVGQNEHGPIFAIKISHAYAAGTWAEFKDAGQIGTGENGRAN